jgi:hypothetical protein
VSFDVTETDSRYPKFPARNFFRDVQSKRNKTEWKMIKGYAV